MNEIIAQLSMSFGPGLPVMIAGVAAFVSVVALWQGLRVRDPLVRRAKSIVMREEELRSAMLAPRRRGLRATVGQSHELMAHVVARLRLLQGNKAQELRDKLATAGLRSREALIVFLFCKLALPLVLAVFGLIALEVFNLYNLSPLGRTFAALAIVTAGAFAPDIWLRNRATKRRKALEKQLPDTLDLLVICVEAGLSLDAALKRSSGELARGAPEMADELALTSVELGFLPDRQVALRNLIKRTGLKSVSAVVGALLQTEKFGTPLAQSLRVLAAEFRNQRLLRAEEKAARLPATLTVPMVIFILPTLFIVLIGPAIINVIDSIRGLGN
jgi:tight adherence protein C